MIRLIDEGIGLGYAVVPYKGNSNFEKAVMYVALAIFTIGGVGLLTGYIVLDSPEKQQFWSLLCGFVFAILLGRNWARGTQHVKRKRKGLPPDDE